MPEKIVGDSRWKLAQGAGKNYWASGETDPVEFVRIFYYKLVFLNKVKQNCPNSIVPPTDRLGEALEIGIGPLGIGVVTLLETLNAWHLTGIDPIPRSQLSESPRYLITLYQSLISLPLDYVNALGEKLPFDSERFDVVVCYNVLDHTQHPYSILREVKRILRPGAYFLLGLDALSLASWLRHRLCINDLAHPYKFTTWDISPMLILPVSKYFTLRNRHMNYCGGQLEKQGELPS